MEKKNIGDEILWETGECPRGKGFKGTGNKEVKKDLEKALFPL